MEIEDTIKKDSFWHSPITLLVLGLLMYILSYSIYLLGFGLLAFTYAMISIIRLPFLFISILFFFRGSWLLASSFKFIKINKKIIGITLIIILIYPIASSFFSQTYTLYSYYKEIAPMAKGHDFENLVFLEDDYYGSGRYFKISEDGKIIEIDTETLNKVKDSINIQKESSHNESEGSRTSQIYTSEISQRLDSNNIIKFVETQIFSEWAGEYEGTFASDSINFTLFKVNEDDNIFSILLNDSRLNSFRVLSPTELILFLDHINHYVEEKITNARTSFDPSSFYYFNIDTNEMSMIAFLDYKDNFYRDNVPRNIPKQKRRIVPISHDTYLKFLDYDVDPLFRKIVSVSRTDLDESRYYNRNRGSKVTIIDIDNPRDTKSYFINDINVEYVRWNYD